MPKVNAPWNCAEATFYEVPSFIAKNVLKDVHQLRCFKFNYGPYFTYIDLDINHIYIHIYNPYIKW